MTVGLYAPARYALYRFRYPFGRYSQARGVSRAPDARAKPVMKLDALTATLRSLPEARPHIACAGSLLRDHKRPVEVTSSHPEVAHKRPCQVAQVPAS